MNVVEHGLIIKFVDGSESFTAGFEAGQVFEKLSEGPSDLSGVYHAENEEVLGRIGRYFGYDYLVSPSSVDGWIDITFRKPDRPRLSIVK